MLMRLQMRMTDPPGQQVIMWKICGQGRAAHVSVRADPWLLVSQQWEDAVPREGQPLLPRSPTPRRPFKVVKCPRLENMAPTSLPPRHQISAWPAIHCPLRTTASSSDPVPTRPDGSLSPSWKVLVTEPVWWPWAAEVRVTRSPEVGLNLGRGS